MLGGTTSLRTSGRRGSQLEGEKRAFAHLEGTSMLPRLPREGSHLEGGSWGTAGGLFHAHLGSRGPTGCSHLEGLGGRGYKHLAGAAHSWRGFPPAWGAQLGACLKAHGCPGTSGEAAGSASRTSGGRRQAGTHLGAHLAAGSRGAHIWRACTNTRHSPTRTRAAASCTSGPPRAHLASAAPSP